MTHTIAQYIAASWLGFLFCLLADGVVYNINAKERCKCLGAAVITGISLYGVLAALGWVS